MCWSKWDYSCEVSEGMSNNKKLASTGKLNVVKIGSKNRLCLPPESVAHIGIRPGDYATLNLETDKNNRNFIILLSVKEENFGVDGEEIIIEDMFKK